MNVPDRREPPIYNSCNYILQNGLTFACPIAKLLNADTKFPRPVTIGLFPIATTKHPGAIGQDGPVDWPSYLGCCIAIYNTVGFAR